MEEEMDTGEMIAKIGDCIVSPLGYGTGENYEAVKAGKSMLTT